MKCVKATNYECFYGDTLGDSLRQAADFIDRENFEFTKVHTFGHSAVKVEYNRLVQYYSRPGDDDMRIVYVVPNDVEDPNAYARDHGLF